MSFLLPALAASTAMSLPATKVINATVIDSETTNGTVVETSGTLTTFHWNVHWQCAVTSWGGSSSCNSQALSKASSLAKSKNADVITLIEVQNAKISGYTKGCESDDYVSLHFKSGWRIDKTACGTMNAGMNQGSRGLSVALVTPPTKMGDCNQICFAAVHAPHYAIKTGISYIKQGCGDVQAKCMVAMGDWNAAGSEAYSQFNRLTGYNANLVEPNQATCCDQSSCSTCQYDHTITNIAGAKRDAETVWDYQSLSKVAEEHKPVSVTLSFSGGGSTGGGDTPSSGSCTAIGSDPYATGHFVECCAGAKKCLEKSAGWAYRCKSCSDSCPDDKSWSGRQCASAEFKMPPPSWMYNFTA